MAQHFSVSETKDGCQRVAGPQSPPQEADPWERLVLTCSKKRGQGTEEDANGIGAHFQRSGVTTFPSQT